jgi:DNA-binding transcriptional LysR family regulator
MLVRYARKMLAIKAETFTQVAGCEEFHGSITLRIPQSLSVYTLPPVLKKFTAQYPQVGLNVSNCSITLQQELRSGIIDLAFLLADSIHTGDLKAEVLGFEKLFLVSDSQHPLASLSSLSLLDLKGVSILLPKQDCSYKMQFEQALTEEKVDFAAILEFNSIEAIKRCVMQGIGITLIPQMAVKKEIDENRLAVLPWPEEGLETAILMIRHKDKWLSPTLRAFMDLVREEISAQLHRYCPYAHPTQTTI